MKHDQVPRFQNRVIQYEQVISESGGGENQCTSAAVYVGLE